MEENNKILIYTDGSGLTKIDVKLEEDTLWLTQAQMCELYQTSKSNVSEHIKHIFEEGELQEETVVRKFRTTAADGKSYLTTFYNLDMIIALGYRVRSVIATRFRQWATERLKEYIVKGFTLDDERLKNLVEVATGRNCSNASETYVPLKRCSTDKCWKSMQQVLTMIQGQLYHRSFSRKSRTRFIMPFMDARLQN